MKKQTKLFVIAVSTALTTGAIPVLTSAYYHSAGTTEKQQAVPSGTKADVVIDATSGLEFAPQRVAIEVGDTVEWRNESSLPHTVTADPSRAAGNVTLPEGANPFHERLNAGESYRHTFKEPGTYRYVCKFHGGMIGVIEVEG